MQVFTELPRETAAPGMARALARAYFTPHADAGRVSDLCLVVSELVTNAVIHGYGRIELRAVLDAGTIRGDVTDQGGGFDPGAESRYADGRGLHVVAGLADRWGIDDHVSRVWFEIACAAGRGPGRLRAIPSGV